MFRLLVQAGDEGVPAGEVARQCDTPANTMSTQLAILMRAGLIRSRRESRSVIYSANYARISDLLGFLMQGCCQGLPAICAPFGPDHGRELPAPTGATSMKRLHLCERRLVRVRARSLVV